MAATLVIFDINHNRTRAVSPISHDIRNPFKMSHAELASSYAALILADDGVEITVRDPRIYLCAPRARND